MLLFVYGNLNINKSGYFVLIHMNLGFGPKPMVSYALLYK
jgi:hypothetical protein